MFLSELIHFKYAPSLFTEGDFFLSTVKGDGFSFVRRRNPSILSRFSALAVFFELQPV